MSRSNFQAVGDFHQRFKLDYVSGNAPSTPKLISPELRDFRLRFLKEELKELEEGYDNDDLAKIADALVDLVYVALGTAHLHGLPWEKLFKEVQRANMTKERCELDHVFVECPTREDTCMKFVGVADDRLAIHACGQPRHKHSLRGNVNDVIKPPGWTGPNIHEVLLKAGWPGPPLPLECKHESRNMNGGCDVCGDPAL